MTLIWTEQVDRRMKELRNEGYTQFQTAEKLSEEFGYNYTRNAVKNRESRIIETTDQPEELLEKLEYKETIEILPDGSHKSDKLIRMNAEQAKNVEFLLKEHGFDKNEWELISARNNIWNTYSKQDGIQTLYSSKITVKPKETVFSLEKLIDSFTHIEPITIETKSIEVKEKRLLEIPLFDAHFGVSDYNYYKPTQSKIMNLLSFRQWEEVLFVIGQDVLHNDGFRGKTANGTPIEQVDMVKAWEDARNFFEPMIVHAVQQSNRVKVMFSKGNHDEAMGWAFVQMLKARFPQVQFDDEMRERKVHVFGATMIGVTHGDKARKNLHNIFPVEFPVEWSKAKNRELHTGHYHVEDSKDVFGMVIRTLATRNKTDQWHRDNGFIGAHKRFMLFEYSEEELECIHYV